MTTAAGLYTDSSLSANVLNVDFLSPWPRLPVEDDFVGSTKPNMQVPVLSWAISVSESDWRTEMISYLTTLFPTYSSQITTNINALPGSFINNTLGNIFYNTTDVYSYAIGPRIDYRFCTSPYAMAELWIGYYLAGMLLLDYTDNTDNESLYRRKQLSDLQSILGYTLRTILGRTPDLSQGSNVIVSATESTSERILIVTDNTRLNTYLSNGGTLNTLCSQWITNKYNPTITG